MRPDERLAQPDASCALSLSLAERNAIVDQLVQEDFEGDRYFAGVDEFDDDVQAPRQCPQVLPGP